MFGLRSKAHRECLDYTPEAEAIFRRIADDFGLEIIKKSNDPVELSMTIPKQPGLNANIWLCLQNLDELWIGIDDFVFSVFPFEKVVADFEVYVRGLLSAEFRIRRTVHIRTGATISARLEKLEGGKWKTASSYGRFSLPFQKTREELFFIREDA